MCLELSDNLSCCNNVVSQARCVNRISGSDGPPFLIQAGRIILKNRIQNKIEKSIANLDQIISISKFMENMLANHSEVRKSRIYTIYNTIDPDLFTPSQSNHSNNNAGDNRLLYVGSLKPQKGIIPCLKAIALCHQQGLQFKLDIVGKGQQYSDAKNYVDQVNISDLVNFHGHINHRSVRNLYEHASLVVFPSVWPEPFGRISIEAMASRTPIVASSAGAIPEVVEDWGGSVIIDPYNTTEFAEAISHQLSQYNSLGNSPPSIDHKFNYQRAAKLHEKAYENY
jgi:glycosyltransferase involved in cell wall biosynthesis